MSLTSVAHLDFDRRTNDLPMWAVVVAGADRVADFACGSGRIPECLGWPCAWYGVDLDPTAVSTFNERVPPLAVGEAICADMANHTPCVDADVAICAFSSLYLLPHNQHADVLRGMVASVKAGGVVAIEVFQPQPRFRGFREEFKSLADGLVRTSRYHTDVSQRITRVVRLYGHAGGEPTAKLSEVIYWRDVEDMKRLLSDAGLTGVEALTARPVPAGMVLLTGRKP